MGVANDLRGKYADFIDRDRQIGHRQTATLISSSVTNRMDMMNLSSILRSTNKILTAPTQELLSMSRIKNE